MQKVIQLGDKGTPTEVVEALAPNPLSGHPVTRVRRQFVHPAGLVNAGIWECAAGSFEIPAHPSHEMCTILEGEAVIEHDDGSRLPVKAGDSILIPKGTRNIWHVSERIRKIFMCCFEPE
ncbi:MAG TPA: DUF861 domain-containing protein [Candidatus Desulfovibrio intestinavium]|uniref:DUF861 domain-containing protein n=1 Tax=Candidatus Desulfovibrio intestinavium TaxID=2838534 RepID=A0A9D2HPK4_9BACT|nr:DUF861 domain-containing protein [Candidatus Desulfovibrio intestinavium]